MLSALFIISYVYDTTPLKMWFGSWLVTTSWVNCAIDLNLLSVYDEKSPFKMLGLSFSLAFDWVSHFISDNNAKFISRKIGTLIYPLKFLFSEVMLYVNVLSYLYCCHVSAGDPNCYLTVLDKLQKQLCTTFGFSDFLQITLLTLSEFKRIN